MNGADPTDPKNTWDYVRSRIGSDAGKAWSEARALISDLCWLELIDSSTAARLRHRTNRDPAFTFALAAVLAALPDQGFKPISFQPAVDFLEAQGALS